EAARKGLSQTLFEKCIARKPETAEMLQVQYRMHEYIMQFSSKYFYEDQLIAHESVRNRTLPGEEKPVEFIDTAGCGYNEAQDTETLSRYNDEEGQLLIRQVEKLITQFGVEGWTYSTGIITPYSAQVERLRKLVESSELLAGIQPFLTINTVDAFQGQERDVIAISLVRSNDKGEVGFLGDIRRINVAMTRAKMKLIIIGDSATLGTHPFYQELLDYVQLKGFYISAWEVV